MLIPWDCRSISAGVKKEEQIMALIPKILAGSVLIVLLANPAGHAADQMKGTVLAVFPEQRSLILADDETGQWTIYLDTQGKVFVDEQTAKFSDLLPGEYVTVNYETRGDRVVATEIRCRRDARHITSDPTTRSKL